jgi:hypothetical protein
MPSINSLLTNLHKGHLHNRRELVGGTFLIAFGLIGLLLTADLSLGKLGRLGPGAFPRGLSILIIGAGVLIFVQSWSTTSEQLPALKLRGPLFVVGAILLFAATIQPLGLLVAAPLAIAMSSLASDETRYIETIVLTIGMTAFCIGLFKLALRLPIPVAPWLGW